MRGGFAFTATNHAYDEPCAPPPMHPMHPSLHGELGYMSWCIISEECKDRGVVVVWKTVVDLDAVPAKPDTIPAPAPVTPESARMLRAQAVSLGWGQTAYAVRSECVSCPKCMSLNSCDAAIPTKCDFCDWKLP